jgi:hypothetical protein
MSPELVARIEAALVSLENLEHRVSTIVEGNRMQLSNLAESLKIRQLRGELRAIAVAIREQQEPQA